MIVQNYLENGHLSFIGSITLGTISWFTPDNIDMTLKVITALGAVISAIFATRYYWYATKEKKKRLKKD